VLDEVLRFLICPRCGASLARDGGSLRCPAGHVFDVARQGYVSLLPAGQKGISGDTAAMVLARESFLAAGHLDHVAAELVRSAARGGRGVTGDACVADVGAGTGHYLAAVLDELPDRGGLALDASKFALRRAARAHARIGAVGCDVRCALPVADGAAAVVLNVFAPRNGAEFRRILAPGGQLIVITPTPAHLSELIGVLGLLTVDQDKQQRLARTLDPHFTRTEKRDISRPVALSRADIMAAVMMGPSAWHADPLAFEARIADLPDPLEVTLSVTLSCYRRSDRRAAASGRR